VQLAPTAIGLLQLLLWTKSAALAPSMEIVEIFSGALPELVRVTTWAIEVEPVLRVTKLSIEGESDTAETPPVPLTPREREVFVTTS